MRYDSFPKQIVKWNSLKPMQIPPNARPQATQRFYAVCQHCHKIKTITEITEKPLTNRSKVERVPHNGNGRLRNHLGGVSIVLYYRIVRDV